MQGHSKNSEQKVWNLEDFPKDPEDVKEGDLFVGGIDNAPNFQDKIQWEPYDENSVICTREVKIWQMFPVADLPTDSEQVKVGDLYVGFEEGIPHFDGNLEWQGYKCQGWYICTGRSSSAPTHQDEQGFSKGDNNDDMQT